MNISYHRYSTSDVTSYKPFIDGMRAVSVLAVVAYHVGVPYVTGGFVGVDVFFVISGFLIIAQIVAGLEDGRFSFADFWARRAIRILPPYLLVILVCIFIAPFIILVPSEYINFGEQVIYSAFMLVNHLFLDQQGYFDSSSDTKILLHLWSLAVEEQFYIFAPVLIVALWVFLRKTNFIGMILVRIAIAAAFAISFFLCVLYTDGDKNYGFYLMPLRAWEFILGGSIIFFVGYVRRLPHIIIESISLVGLIIVFFSIFSFSENTPFPSYLAALPAVGASSVILAGLAHPRGIVVSFLAVKPMTSIGLVSYSWYLWHWPLLAFARIYNFGEHLIRWDLAMGILSLILAIHTHLWLERPLRSWRRRSTSVSSWQPTFLGIFACAHIALLGYVFAYLAAPRLDMVAGATAAADESRPPVPHTCRLDVMQNAGDCIALAAGRPIGLLMGDSHAKAAFPAVYRHGDASGVLVANLPLNGCAPFFNVVKYRASGVRNDCQDAQANGQKWLVHGEITLSFAIFVAQWDFHRSGLAYKLGDPPPRDQRKIFIEKLRESIKIAQNAGAQRVLIVGNVPLFSINPAECIARSKKYGIGPDGHCSLDRSVVEDRRKRTIGWINQAIGSMKGVRFIDPIDVFCDKEKCRPFDGETILYSDYSHVNDDGAEKIYSEFPEKFEWVFGK